MKSFYKRLKQSQNDRRLVRVLWRNVGDSKTQKAVIQSCKVEEFFREIRSKSRLVEEPKVEKL